LLAEAALSVALAVYLIRAAARALRAMPGAFQQMVTYARCKIALTPFSIVLACLFGENMRAVYREFGIIDDIIISTATWYAVTSALATGASLTFAIIILHKRRRWLRASA
jgi:hypothetical protein